MTQNKNGNLNFQKFSGKDKSLLRKRIYSSIYAYRLRRHFFRFTVAASAAVVAVFLTFSLFNSKVSNSAIEKFAKIHNDKTTNQDVQLILNDNKNISITAKNAQISYSNSGEEVSIGKSNSVAQHIASSSEPIFNTLIVPFGKRSEIVLSDGSKVWLNSGSKLIFPARFTVEKREVYLEGEAIFEVSHNKNKPFFVKSKNHEIQVLGTVFNVNNYNDDDAIYTVLKSGSVQINYTSNTLFDSEKNIKMKPGTKVTFNKEKHNVNEANVDVEPYFSWRDGVFIFKNDPLKSIMKKISRYYDVEIIIADNARANETFSGYLDVKDSIESVLETIKEAEPPGFEYKFSADHKIIIN
ncbi:FecR family protein [Aequorivita antarctica]|uniref:DUF4974 domain-containing protein n=1 Tax=Aequorivita antarctica TaxID=153266 RepID=A0A5C6Z1B1_9FLAO|nr:FecR domain-containing protein [Aequorivita antarctica]TXD73838.1 DUF4974 domain-containing protein [Aequorivita antarctica]SRX73446.1 hypothetical protein AEQU3_00884 [Aequorivita antarctica]